MTTSADGEARPGGHELRRSQVCHCRQRLRRNHCGRAASQARPGLRDNPLRGRAVHAVQSNLAPADAAQANSGGEGDDSQPRVARGAPHRSAAAHARRANRYPRSASSSRAASPIRTMRRLIATGGRPEPDRQTGRRGRGKLFTRSSISTTRARFPSRSTKAEPRSQSAARSSPTSWPKPFRRADWRRTG